MTKTFAIPDQDYANSGWIQALMGVIDPVIQQSRLSLKKHMDSIDILCSLTTIREKADSLQSSIDSLWKYANENELAWLLTTLPASQLHWVVGGTDLFTLEQKVAPEFKNASEWAGAMGIFDWQTQLTMRILSGDFVSWQRRVARHGSNAPVEFTMESSGKAMLELPSTATWKANQWADGAWNFSIDGQPFMELASEEPVYVSRPEPMALMESAMLTIGSADDRFAKKRVKGVLAEFGLNDWVGWSDSVPILSDMHEAVLGVRGLKCSTAFRTIWATIWPILYCRRKRLQKGSCSLAEQRKRLDMCLKAEPSTVIWIALFGDLLYQTRVGDGLGISAKYKD